MPPALLKEFAKICCRTKALLMANGGTYADTELALEFLKQNAAKDKVSAEDLRTEAKILLARNRYQDRLAVIKILETLADQNELKLDEQFLLARTYEKTKQWPLAKLQYQQIVKSTRDAAVLARYTYSLIAHEELEEAKPWLDQLKQTQKDSFGITLLDASFQHASGDVDAAVRLVQQGIDNLADVDSPIRPSPIWSSRASWKKLWNHWKPRLGRKTTGNRSAALGKVRHLLAGWQRHSSGGNTHTAIDRFEPAIWHSCFSAKGRHRTVG